MQECKTGHPRN